MPAESVLVEDLGRMVDLYGDAIAVKRSLLMAAPGVVSSSSSEMTTAAKDLLRDFAPKSDADYVSHLSGNAIVKTRRHETLVREYGELAKGIGLSPATNVHPRDLTLLDEGVEWLVEAKVVYLGNATNAVRDAIGQLFQYRHFLYPPDSGVRLAALFTEPVGQAFVDLLQELGIEAIWKSPSGWEGSPGAVTAHLV